MPGLVQEVSDAGEDHGEARFVCGFDDVRIADGAAWLDYRRGPCFDKGFESVGEGEEGAWIYAGTEEYDSGAPSAG